MKQKLSVNKNRELPAYYLFFIGCVIGIVLPNLIYKMQWKQNTVSALYLMGIYAEKGSREYFWKVLRMRGGLFLLVAGSGLTIFGVLVAVGGMILLGIGVGMGFGWHRMDSLFLGGMIAMSSTTVIYKAFDDLGLRKKQFTGLVLSILILEDILAIVLMVMLSTMAVSQHFEGTEMLESIGKLLFFLILWCFFRYFV